MFSENVMSADNQQERLDINWIVGFVDGEGCFHISINKIDKMSLGWQVLPEFRIVQNEDNEQVLHKIQEYFGFGKVTLNRKDHHGIRKEYRVRGLENLNELTRFFHKYALQTKTKKESFEIFSTVIKMMNNKEHLTKEGLNKIAKMVTLMNRKPKLKYLESSETIRQSPKKLG
jgi:uncharacterized protein YlzI (FlbEa/FlbD family)